MIMIASIFSFLLVNYDDDPMVFSTAAKVHILGRWGRGFRFSEYYFGNVISQTRWMIANRRRVRSSFGLTHERNIIIDDESGCDVALMLCSFEEANDGFGIWSRIVYIDVVDLEMGLVHRQRNSWHNIRKNKNTVTRIRKKFFIFCKIFYHIRL